MHGRGILVVTTLFALCLLACGPTAAQVNNSGHEPYIGGDYASALKSYQDAQGRDPAAGAPHYNSGNVLYRIEEYEGAIENFDESLRYAEDDLRSSGFFNRGNTAFQQEQYPEAVEAYKEVLRMNPADHDAKHNLELALMQLPPDEQEEEQEQDEQQQDEEEQEEQEEEQEQDEESGEQEQPITESQARQILESVGEAAQTLQERRGQVLVSPKPPSEFDW